jgi:hypothetical protein
MMTMQNLNYPVEYLPGRERPILHATQLPGQSAETPMNALNQGLTDFDLNTFNFVSNAMETVACSLISFGRALHPCMIAAECPESNVAATKRVEPQ